MLLQLFIWLLIYKLGDLFYSQKRSEDASKVAEKLCKVKDIRAHVVVGNTRRMNMNYQNFEDRVKDSYKFYFHVTSRDKK
jgi:hypothetical protein